MNPVTTLALVVLFPVACLLALLGLGWLEDSLERTVEADVKRSGKHTAPVVEIPVQRTEPALERSLRPTRAAS